MDYLFDMRIPIESGENEFFNKLFLKPLQAYNISEVDEENCVVITFTTKDGLSYKCKYQVIRTIDEIENYVKMSDNAIDLSGSYFSNEIFTEYIKNKTDKRININRCFWDGNFDLSSLKVDDINDHILKKIYEISRENQDGEENYKEIGFLSDEMLGEMALKRIEKINDEEGKIFEFNNENIQKEINKRGIDSEYSVFANGGVNLFSFKASHFVLNFAYSKFLGGSINFEKAELDNSLVDLSECFFQNVYLEFRETNFGNRVIDFCLSIFENCTFSFNDSKLSSGQMRFVNAKFTKGYIYFTEAKYENSTIDFRFCIFDYTHISCYGMTIDKLQFDSSKFLDEIDLRCKELKRLYIVNCTINVILRCDKYKNSYNKFEELSFQGTINLGMIFIDFDKNNIEKAISSSHIFDDDAQSEITSEEKTSQYRMLKENFNKIGYYSDEDKSYRLYMHYKSNKKWHLKPFGLIGGYGTKPMSILFCAIAIIILFGFIYSIRMPIMEKPIFSESIICNFMTISANIKQGIYFSAITFLTVGYGDISPTTEVVGFLATIEGFIGLFMMSYFTVSVVRKILR